jgi:cytochrome b
MLKAQNTVWDSVYGLIHWGNVGCMYRRIGGELGEQVGVALYAI